MNADASSPTPSPHTYPPPTGAGWPTPYGPVPPRPTASRWRARLALGVGATLLVGGSLTTGAVLGVHSRQVQLDQAASPSIVVEPPDATWGTQPRATLPQQEGGQGQQGQQDQQGDGRASGAGSASDATEQQSTGLVQISSTLTNGSSAGTGIVLSSDGTVVTNHHVVEGATSMTVRIVTTGRTYKATYVGGDATADVAVIKLQGASGLTTAPLASTPAQVGDTITSVGDAGGDGGSLTAAPGTVTATGQAITVQGEGGDGSNRLTGLMQLQAYVVPGDSGGAVLDSAGRVVGMNVAASSNARDVTGYAIPLATVSRIAEQILAGDASGDVTLGYSGFLGVGLADDTTGDGPLIAQVYDGGAAADAGIAAGDTITAVDGRRVTTAEELQTAVRATRPGDRVRISWTTQDGATRSATVTLGQAPVS